MVCSFAAEMGGLLCAKHCHPIHSLTFVYPPRIPTNNITYTHPRIHPHSTIRGAVSVALPAYTLTMPPLALLLVVSACVAACADPMPGSSNITVLVFGDSWGSLGPSWHELADMFERHSVSATVRSTAIGGTQACQWAAQDDGAALANEAAKTFPEVQGKVDFVWYTLGGNDYAEKGYQSCDQRASTMAANLECGDRLTGVITNCTRTMLKKMWAASPQTQVMQAGYDLPCMGTTHNPKQCLPSSRVPFCGSNVTCGIMTSIHWQKPLLEPLATEYPHLYTGLNILGTVQQAGGVAGASPGHPVMTMGSPCELMTECVHPTYGKAGAKAVGEAFWSMYFQQHVGDLRRSRETEPRS